MQTIIIRAMDFHRAMRLLTEETPVTVIAVTDAVASLRLNERQRNLLLNARIKWELYA